QYLCAYCHKSFGSKNKAEHHQNSLHLCHHSWSCSMLLSYAAEFHSSSTRLDEADTCGYCGEDFPHSEPGPTVPIATQRDWETRIGHLREMHRFEECDHTRKFFRVDHFGQHLKHSHAAASGKWTHLLEKTCMKDEHPHKPI
ncbi:hypothetical protein B0O99DRAFT_483314, partial [Bisporella sp. PMI_857]